MRHIDPLSLGSRREFLRRVGMGLGGVAMASLLQQELRGADIRVDPLRPLAARKPPLPCKAKRQGRETGQQARRAVKGGSIPSRPFPKTKTTWPKRPFKGRET